MEKAEIKDQFKEKTNFNERFGSFATVSDNSHLGATVTNTVAPSEKGDDTSEKYEYTEPH